MLPLCLVFVSLTAVYRSTPTPPVHPIRHFIPTPSTFSAAPQAAPPFPQFADDDESRHSVSAPSMATNSPINVTVVNVIERSSTTPFTSSSLQSPDAAQSQQEMRLQFDEFRQDLHQLNFLINKQQAASATTATAATTEKTTRTTLAAKIHTSPSTAFSDQV